ncbi:hypothetical protein XELAEV_18004920mg [Xenopus laevis]|uniref:Uncharacterized protein n=1 Tax=Xenopus laevis TaxID=8355 RepID=A0A974DVW8_XENLA|nr:hypothetical protein XELAEV_18004920mg [Xenopus laevis]
MFLQPRFHAFCNHNPTAKIPCHVQSRSYSQDSIPCATTFLHPRFHLQSRSYSQNSIPSTTTFLLPFHVQSRSYSLGSVP